MALTWMNAAQITAQKFVCSYCDNLVGTSQGFCTNAAPQGKIYICPFCGNPTYFDPALRRFPGAPFGSPVASVPPDTNSLYEEARRCVTLGSFTSAVLTCRKLLMHIATEKGAPVGKSFLEYVEYLAGKGYVPPDGQGWVDQIRTKGNEANHEIKVMSADDAKDLITFSEMLLKFVYEFPAKVKPPTPSSP
jgi:hypothetical protein